MTVQEAISARHSVRTYLTKPVEPAIVNALRAEIRACNAEGGLHIQLVMNEPMAFRGFFAHYGKFRGVCNYIVLAGKRAKDLDERAGWFGERLVLLAQTLGLNTCWVGLTFSKAVARRSYVLGTGRAARVCDRVRLWGRAGRGAREPSDARGVPCRPHAARVGSAAAQGGAARAHGR